jgi:hypothetical protein
LPQISVHVSRIDEKVRLANKAIGARQPKHQLPLVTDTNSQERARMVREVVWLELQRNV